MLNLKLRTCEDQSECFASWATVKWYWFLNLCPCVLLLYLEQKSKHTKCFFKSRKRKLALVTSLNRRQNDKIFWRCYTQQLKLSKLKVQSCKLYSNKYMIASRQTINTKIFAFISVLVLKLLSGKVLFTNRKRQ